MFQYVLFDLDGTLTDPKTGITSCVQYALADAGIEEPDLDKLEPFIGPPLTDSFREFYGFDDEQIKRAIDKYHERFDEKGIFENEIIEGIPELLKALKDAGRRVSIASSKPMISLPVATVTRVSFLRLYVRKICRSSRTDVL